MGTTIVVAVRPRVLEAYGVRMFKSSQRPGQGGAVLTESVGPNLIEQIVYFPTAIPTEKWTEVARLLAAGQSSRRLPTTRPDTRW